jgi:hypothetical protein
VEVAWFDPSISEIATIERIETVYYDPTLSKEQRGKLLKKFWAELEILHQDKVSFLVSPEGKVLQSPFETQPK